MKSTRNIDLQIISHFQDLILLIPPMFKVFHYLLLHSYLFEYY